METVKLYKAAERNGEIVIESAECKDTGSAYCVDRDTLHTDPVLSLFEPYQIINKMLRQNQGYGLTPKEALRLLVQHRREFAATCKKWMESATQAANLAEKLLWSLEVPE